MTDQIITDAVLSTLDARWGTSIEDVVHELTFVRLTPLTQLQAEVVLRELVVVGLVEKRMGMFWRAAVKVKTQAELF